MDLGSFEKLVGVSFKNRALLRQAFTHRSYLNENRKNTLEHNERLEFLGDAVLELIITVYLFKTYPDKPEGELTSYRAAVVNAQALAKVAKDLHMESLLLLSRGEKKDTGKARQIILANTIEALIGAIFLDQGYKEAERFVIEHIASLVDTIVKEGAWIDSKSFFQEQAQEKVGVTPVYKVVKEIGPDHDRSFTVGVYLRDEMIADGDGKSKQEAEQVAAAKALNFKGWNK